jgi:hypothetical protein
MEPACTSVFTDGGTNSNLHPDIPKTDNEQFQNRK